MIHHHNDKYNEMIRKKFFLACLHKEKKIDLFFYSLNNFQIFRNLCLQLSINLLQQLSKIITTNFSKISLKAFLHLPQLLGLLSELYIFWYIQSQILHLYFYLQLSSLFSFKTFLP